MSAAQQSCLALLMRWSFCQAAAGAELKEKLIDVIQNSKAEATQ